MVVASNDESQSQTEGVTICSTTRTLPVGLRCGMLTAEGAPCRNIVGEQMDAAEFDKHHNGHVHQHLEQVEEYFREGPLT
jgi:hypothetical protein